MLITHTHVSRCALDTSFMGASAHQEDQEKLDFCAQITAEKKT